MKLKPCPFCGAKGVRKERGSWSVNHLESCYFTGMSHFECFMGETAQRWNTRKGFKVGREKMNK